MISHSAKQKRQTRLEMKSRKRANHQRSDVAMRNRPWVTASALRNVSAEKYENSMTATRRKSIPIRHHLLRLADRLGPRGVWVGGKSRSQSSLGWEKEALAGVKIASQSCFGSAATLDATTQWSTGTPNIGATAHLVSAVGGAVAQRTRRSLSRSSVQLRPF